MCYENSISENGCLRLVVNLPSLLLQGNSCVDNRDIAKPSKINPGNCNKMDNNTGFFQFIMLFDLFFFVSRKSQLIQ
jgi:hypothetical protein